MSCNCRGLNDLTITSYENGVKKDPNVSPLFKSTVIHGDMNYGAAGLLAGTGLLGGVLLGKLVFGKSSKKR